MNASPSEHEPPLAEVAPARASRLVWILPLAAAGDAVALAENEVEPLRVLALLLVIVLLGTILDSASIMLLTLPIALPILMGANVDLIWLGVLTVLAVEIGLLTPPFGIAVFVIKATLGPDSRITLGEIFIGALPFAVMMALVLALVFLFPSLATALL